MPSPGHPPPPPVFPPGVTPVSPQNGKIHVGYKDLMENYQIVVNNLAAERGEKDTNLVLNLFQSLLDEFTRGHTKNDFEPPKVGGAASGRGWGGPGCSQGPHRRRLCAPLAAEQSPEEEAEAGSRCEYSRRREGVLVSVFSGPALGNPGCEWERLPRDATGCMHARQPQGETAEGLFPPTPHRSAPSSTAPRSSNTTGTYSPVTR